MQIGELLKEERKKCGVTQEQLAKLIGVSRPTITHYENGRGIPEDVFNLILEALNSRVLMLVKRGTVLPSFYLDGADLSPLATLFKGLEMIERAKLALKSIDIVNKPSFDSLSGEEYDILTQNIKEIQKTKNCLELILLSFSDNYQLDLGRVNEEIREELVEKNYLKQRSKELIA